MSVFTTKPKIRKRQVIRCIAQIAVSRSLCYIIWLLGFAVIVLGIIALGALIVGSTMSLFMATMQLSLPWPSDWVLQLATGYGLTLYALGFIHLMYKLYRAALHIERNRKEYL